MKGFGNVAEKRSAVRLHIKQQPASGRFPGAKGDLKGYGFVIEQKATRKNSLSVKYEWLMKIMKQAALQGSDAALLIEFCTGDGRPRPAGAWVAMPEWKFKELVGGEDGGEAEVASGSKV